MKRRAQSECPVCFSLDIFGDKWTLLIVRDLLVYGKRHYREFLASGEGIATNILADRLKSLVDNGLVQREDDPAHKSQAIYTPTAKALALAPVLEAMVTWGMQNGPASLKWPPGTKPDAASPA